MKHFATLSLLFLMFTSLIGQSLAERLGYPKDAKLLIIHADDLGVSHSENAASIRALEKGSVNSASIMVPCHWFPEIAAYAKSHPEADLGLHLTLTSEWKHLKWGPSAAVTEVPSLVDETGFFYDNCIDFSKKAKLEEVEIELRAQIERALAFGVKPTHLDSHMGCLFFQKPELFALYLKLGREYKIPVLLANQLRTMLPPAIGQYLSEEDIFIDRVISASPTDFDNGGMEAFYTQALHHLQPGVTEIIIHTAYDNAEMQAVCVDHPHFGSAWRQQDFDFFTSKKCRQIIEEEGIVLVRWKDIGKLIGGK